MDDKRAGRSELEEIRDELENLASEAHKLRGTLSLYAPRQELDEKVAELERARMRFVARQRAQYQAAVRRWVVAIVLMAAGFASLIGLNRTAINDLDARLDVLEQE